MSQIDKVTAAATVYHSNRNDTVIFQSIKSTVRTTGLSEFFLRRLLKEGNGVKDNRCNRTGCVHCGRFDFPENQR